MPTEDFRRASLPLFQKQLVECLEWTFDAGFDRAIPLWVENLLAQFSEQESLLGHSFFLSPMSLVRPTEIEESLKKFSLACTLHKYQHISEHYGFFADSRHFDGAPLPMPYHQSLVKTLTDSLKDLSRAAGSNVTVGLENLALAFSKEDIQAQGRLLKETLTTTNGFLVLDLHNLYCQMVNFNLTLSEILFYYPLELVEELHISGGSWWEPEQTHSRRIRRDTHDGSVPPQVMALIGEVVPLCPALKWIILERMGGTICTREDESEFVQQYMEIRQRVKSAK